MSIPVSMKSLSNRRLYLKNRRTLVDFSEDGQMGRVTLGENLCEKSIEALKPDLVSIGTMPCACRPPTWTVIIRVR